MAIIKQGSTTLNAGAKGDKGDKGDTGAAGTGSGVGIVISILSDFDNVGVNDIASIQGDIDLVTTTVNIPSGVTLRFEGGSIINGTLSSVTNDCVIVARPYDNILGIDVVLTGIKANEIYPEWFGAIADGIENPQSGTDNRLNLQAAIDFAENNGKLIIGGGNYYCTVDDQLGQDPRIEGALIVHSNTVIEFKNKSYIIVTPNLFTYYVLLSIKEADNVTLFSKNLNGGLKGDFINDKLNNPSEYGHLITTSHRCTNITIDGIELADSYGDGVKNVNYDGFVRDSNGMELGTINKTTGAYEVSATEIRDIQRWDLTYSAYRPSRERFTSFALHNEFHIVGGSYGGFYGIDNGIVDIFFYDTNGDFIEVYEDTEMYDRIKFPSNATECALVSKQASNYFPYKNTTTTAGQTSWSASGLAIPSRHKLYLDDNLLVLDIDYSLIGGVITFLAPIIPISDGQVFRLELGVAPRLKAQEICVGLTIKNCWIHDVSRNCISGTGVQDLNVLDCTLEKAKGTLPQAGIDIEDYATGNKRINIERCTFKNNVNYDIVFIETWGAKVVNNHFIGQKSNLHLGTIANTEGINIEVSGNFFEWAKCYPSNGSRWNDNNYKYSVVEVSGGVYRNEYLFNSSISVEDNETPIIIDNIVMENDDKKDAQTGLGGSFNSIESSGFRRISNFKIIGSNEGVLPQLRGSNTIFNGFETENLVVQIYCDKVDNLRASGVTLWGTPLDNSYIIYKDWTITGDTASIRSRMSSTSLSNLEFNNLTLSSAALTNVLPLIDIDNDFGSLIIRDSKIIDRGTTNTNWSVINFDATVTKFRMFNTEVVTATAGNLLAKGTSTEDATWLYKDNIFTNVILNNALGTELNNFEE